MLTLDALTCKRGERVLFSRLGVTVGEGSAVMLRGRNGAGKTSLLRMLAGFLPPEQGAVYWEGEEIAADPDAYRRDLHYIGDKAALRGDMTLSENLHHWTKLSNTPELLRPAVAYFKLESMMDKPCRTLSAGWRRRAALAMLMLKPSRLWLLDEPMAHLDREARTMITNLIAARCDQGGIAIVACQDDTRLPFGEEIFLEDFRAAS